MITATAATERACVISLGSVFSCWTAKIIGNELNFMEKRTEVLKCLMTLEQELGDTMSRSESFTYPYNFAHIYRKH